MNNVIIGGEEELKVLGDIYESTEPHFLTVYERRRIGKTFILTSFLVKVFRVYLDYSQLIMN